MARDSLFSEEDTFDIEQALPLLREAVRPYPRAALFELAHEGHDTVFEILTACIISIRTRDETTLPLARRLFARARTVAEVAQLPVDELTTLLEGCAFHENKAQQIHEIAGRVVADYQGELPGDREVLLSFRGVGPKCANLTLGIACGEPYIGVDIHVHRITNRWGYVKTTTPEKTMVALQNQLPREYWVEINAVLVPFGKHICTPSAPSCSTCPLLSMCQQVGVTKHR